MKIATKTLDELGYVRRGKSKHRPRDAAHLYDGPYPFIQTGDVKNAGLHISEYTQTYSAAGLEQSKLWKSGTLCITIAANIADTAILSFDACFPDSIIGFVPDQKKSDARYIKYLFDAVLQKRFKKFTQGATQDNLSQKKLLSLKLLVAEDVNDQKVIADKIAIYDDLIGTNRRRIQLLEESARLLFREWFVYYRFPRLRQGCGGQAGHEKACPVRKSNSNGVKIVDGVPEGWNIGKIKDLGKIVTGKTPSKKDDRNYNGAVPFIKTPDMHQSTIILKTEESLSETGASSQNNKYLPPWSILISCIGTVGVVAMNLFKSQTNQQINSVIPKNDIYRYYSFFCLSRLKPLLEAIGGGSTMANINKNKFENIKIIIPSENMLTEFHRAIDSVFNQIALLSDQNEKLGQARDLLLPRLMSGAIEV